MDKLVMISNASFKHESPVCPMASVTILNNCSPEFVKGALTHYKYPLLKVIYVDSNPKSTEFLKDLVSNNHYPTVYMTENFIYDLSPIDPFISPLSIEAYKEYLQGLLLRRPTFY